MRDLYDSLRLIARSLARQPGLVLVVVLTLGLGIGASTALFTYLAAIVWPRFDIRDVERAVWVSTGTVEAPHAGSSYADFQELLRRQGQPAAVGDLAGFSAFAATLTYGSTSTFAWGNMTSGGYFAFFGARPALGRLLDPADDRPGAPAALVVSHAFWRRALGATPMSWARRCGSTASPSPWWGCSRPASTDTATSARSTCRWRRPTR